MRLSGRTWVILLFVVAIAAGLGVTWLLYPSPIIPHSVTVPQVQGSPSDQAVAALASVGLRGRLAGELEDPITPRGAVSWQSPVSGTRLPQGAIVRLGISAGPPRVLVPDVSALDLTAAREVLGAAGLVIGAVDSAWSDVPVGAVVQTDPEERGSLRAGGTVNLTLSKGPRRPHR